MAVKAVVLDLDGTLIDGRQRQVQGISEMLAGLRDLGLQLAIASNRPGAARKVQRAGLDTDLVLDNASVGANKGSPAWANKVVEEFGIESNEVVWLGDTDGDMRSAVNAEIIYFNAGWSNSNYQYGINLSAPSLLPLYLSEFFLKPVSWYWQLNRTDRQGHHVAAKAMMDARGAGISILQNDLVKFLKDGHNPRVGPMRMRDFIFLHFVGSVFGDPFYREVDIWAVYPGHTGGPNNVLGPLANLIAGLFRDRYVRDLLVRHTESMDSGTSRLQKIDVDFYNQSNTVRVNPAYRQRIEDKCIVLIDDFTTKGYSVECARLLLLKAGAGNVICTNIGKYGLYHSVVSGAANYNWNPFEATEHADGSFGELSTPGDVDQNALTVVRESYQRIDALGRGR